MSLQRSSNYRREDRYDLGEGRRGARGSSRSPAPQRRNRAERASEAVRRIADLVSFSHAYRWRLGLHIRAGERVHELQTQREQRGQGERPGVFHLQAIELAEEILLGKAEAGREATLAVGGVEVVTRP